MTMSFATAKLDIMQSCLVGRVEFRGANMPSTYSPRAGGKVLKLPFRPGTKRTRFTARPTGEGLAA